MGIKGLWQLLLPTGRRISIETLQGKRLAIDASIWLVQFLKANRDPETGKVRANSHLLGFLRRICKLLFHGIRPVFVFDGATPEIKLAEIRRRRERRDRLQTFKSDDDEGVKRLARRILISNLKKQKENEKNLEHPSKSGFAVGFFSPRDENGGAVGNNEIKHEKIDQNNIHDADDEIIILSESQDYLKQAYQRDQPMQVNDWDHLSEDATSHTSDESIDVEVNEDDFDVEALSQLPSKMRVSIIEKVRVKQRLNSRKEFMSVAANPQNYSRCQLRNFLKSSRLNQKVSKLATVVKGEDGLQGERIASDSTKRIIFTKQSESGDQVEGSKQEYDEEKQVHGSTILGKSRLKSITSSKNDDEESDVLASSRIHSRRMILGSELNHDDEDVACTNLKRKHFNISQSEISSDHRIDGQRNGGNIEIRKRRQIIDLSDDDNEIQTSNISLLVNHLGDEEGGFLKQVEKAPQYDVGSDSEVRDEENEIQTPNSSFFVNSTEDEEGGFLKNEESAERVDLAPRFQAGEEKCIQNSSDDEDVHAIFVTTRSFPVQSIARSDCKLVEHHSSDVDELDDVDWEDCEINEPQSLPRLNISSHIDESEYESVSFLQLSEIQENTFSFGLDDGNMQKIGKGTPACIDLYCNNDDSSVLESSEVHDGTDLLHSDSISHSKKDETFSSEKQNLNTEAIMRAQATASQLTDWAGRAVQRAIAAHFGESNTEQESKQKDIEESSQSDSSVLSNHFIHNSSPVKKSTITMDTSLEGLSNEDLMLREESNRMQRDMDAVTDEMVFEVMELLTLFGIPYMKAPAEAEAQCVELERLGLVDGVVTEDSDAIVFGCKTLYKNIFEDKKYVEVYLSSDSEKIGIGSKEKIALAMLLGGDYTQGVKGVGIVNGMEILEAFGPWSQDADVGDRLKAFRKWLDGYDISDDADEEDPSNPIIRFQKKHRSARSRWIVPSDFPAMNVLQAYSRPVVDSSQTVFSWEKPNMEHLRSFLFHKIGWDASETNKVVLPIILPQSRQTRLDAYFMRMEDEIKFADVKSKRLREVWGISKKKDEEDYK